MKKKYDVVVVGGGPAGSICALEIAKAGHSVCVLEKTSIIGSPVRCGEAIGYTGLTQFVKPESSWIASKISSVNLIAPNKKNIKINFKNETGFILNRCVFDYDLSNISTKAGAEVYTSAYVSGLMFKNDYVTGVEVDYNNNKKIIESNIVIGADGIDSRIGRWANIKTNVKMKDMESCLQYSVSNININQNEMIMYVGKTYAPGGYLWIFPKGNGMANIGIGISGKYSKYKSAKEYLDEFINKNYSEVSIMASVAGGVICSSPIKSPISNGLMLVGDAAHQTNPMTGGGIASGMKGGEIAGKVAVQSLISNNYSAKFLERYPKLMFKEFGRNYERLYGIKETINRLDDNDLNQIAMSVASIPMEKRTLASIFKKAVFKKPSILIDVIKIFSGI